MLNVTFESSVPNKIKIKALKSVSFVVNLNLNSKKKIGVSKVQLKSMSNFSTSFSKTTEAFSLISNVDTL